LLRRNVMAPLLPQSLIPLNPSPWCCLLIPRTRRRAITPTSQCTLRPIPIDPSLLPALSQISRGALKDVPPKLACHQGNYRSLLECSKQQRYRQSVHFASRETVQLEETPTTQGDRSPRPWLSVNQSFPKGQSRKRHPI
jgi:hypothetical protein